MKTLVHGALLAALFAAMGSGDAMAVSQLNVMVPGTAGFTNTPFDYNKDSSNNYFPLVQLFDGTNPAGTSSNPLYVQFGAAQAVTGTFWQSTQPVSLASLPALAAGSNTIGGVTLPPQTSGGWHTSLNASLTSAVVVKSSAGIVAGIQCDALSGTAVVYAQLLNTASYPALGTNVVDYVPIAAGGSNGKMIPLPGATYSTGISVGLATTPTGSTAAATAGNCSVYYN